MRLADWVDVLPALISRPLHKLIAEVTFGILASGSLQQSEIARALDPGDLNRDGAPASEYRERAASTHSPAVGH